MWQTYHTQQCFLLQHFLLWCNSRCHLASVYLNDSAWMSSTAELKISPSLLCQWSRYLVQHLCLEWLWNHLISLLSLLQQNQRKLMSLAETATWQTNDCLFSRRHNVMTGAEYAVRTSQAQKQKVWKQMRQMLNNLIFTRNSHENFLAPLLYLSYHFSFLWRWASQRMRAI